MCKMQASTKNTATATDENKVEDCRAREREGGKERDALRDGCNKSGMHNVCISSKVQQKIS